MRTTIFCYSGAGNSLALAKELKKSLDTDVELVRIGGQAGEEGIETDSDAVGFVFPVYFHSIPSPVAELIPKLRIRENAYLFAIVGCYANAGHSLIDLDGRLREKGLRLSLGRSVVMPGVSIVDGYQTCVQANSDRRKEAATKMQEIASAVKQRSVEPIRGDVSPQERLISQQMEQMAEQFLSPTLFRVSDTCVGCGTCSRICPNENIKMVSQRPTWSDRCLHCMACLHWCPQETIELGTHSPGKIRVRHPDVTLDEILLR